MPVFYEYPDGQISEYAEPVSWVSGKRLPEKEGREKRIAYCRRELRKLLKPGATVYTILRHTSASGMSRHIDLMIVHKGTPRVISTLAAGLMRDRQTDGGAIVVGGCGMDMGFHLVYNLGYSLWPEGTRKPHGTRNGEPDTSGGYALKHQWL